MTIDTNNKDHWMVVVNNQQQYSLWPTAKALPGGWQSVEIPQDWLACHKAAHPDNSAKSTCLAYIGEIWQDLSPLSVRQHLASLAQPLQERTA